MKLKSRITFIISVLLILGVFLGILFFIPKLEKSSAAGLSCASAQAGNWSEAATWGSCGGGVPGAADNVAIAHAVTLTGDVDITTGIITVNTGGTLDTSGTNYAVSAAKLTINAGGIVTANSSIITLSGTGTVFTKTGTFNYNTSTFKYTGGTANTNIASATYYNLYLDHASTTYTAAGNITVTNVFTVNSGTFNASSRTITLSGTTGAPFVNNGTLTIGTSTISYTGDNPTGNTTILSTPYYNLTFNNASETFMASGSLTLSGNLTITAGTFNPGQDINIAGSWSNTGTFVAGGNTVTFNGVTTTADIHRQYTLYKNITSGGSAFNDIIFDNVAGGWQPLDAMSVDGNFTINAGIFLGNQSVTVNGGNVTGNGTINLVYGTFLLDGTGDFGGTTDWTFNNLIFGDGAGSTTTTKTSTNDITLTGVLMIATNQTLDAGSATWTLTGPGTSFVKNGTFTKSTSTIRYAPYQTATVTAADYYNLEIVRSVVGMSDVWIPCYWNLKKFNSSGDIIGTYYVRVQPRGIAIDASGNIWVASRYDNIITKLSSSGIVISELDIGTIMYGLFGVVVDTTGNIWVENYEEKNVKKINGLTNEVIGTYNLSSGSWGGIINDASDNIWVANSSDASITKLNNSGETIGVYPVGTTPHSVAVDDDGNIWVGNYGSGDVTKLNGSTGALIGTYPVGDQPHAVFGDASGNIWTVNTGSDDVTKLNASTGDVIGTYAVGDNPIGGSVDSLGNIWVESANDTIITKLNGLTGELIGNFNLNMAPGDWSYTFGDFTGFALQHFTCGGSCGAGKDVTLSAGTFNVTNDFTIGDGTNPITVNARTNAARIRVSGSLNTLANAALLVINHDREVEITDEPEVPVIGETLTQAEDIIQDVITNIQALSNTLVQSRQQSKDDSISPAVSVPAAPTITNIQSQGDDIFIEGEAAPNTTVYITIHSDPFNTQTTANSQGKWSYLLKNAIKIIGEGDHTIFATSSVKAADGTELSSDQSKTYDFKLTIDNDKLKVEMKKTKTWQIVAGVFGLLFILSMVFFVLKRKRG